MGILGKLIQKNNETAPAGPLDSKPMLGLSISAGVVKATIWELKDHTIEIIGLGIKNYSDSGKESHPDFRNISEKVADAIDLACQVAEVDVKQTVFGVPQSWIVEEQMLPEYDELMTKLAKNLDLEAVAYVSIPHSLSYYLQYLHKTPTTTVLIGTAREGAQIAYVENGKIKETSYIQWSGGNLGKNIDNGLLKFNTMSELPPTMFLYGFGDLSTARDELAKYDWSSSDRLGGETKAPVSITAPKVIILEEHADSLAVALVGAKDYARHNNIHGRLTIKSLEYSSMNSQTPAIVEQALPMVPEKPFFASELSDTNTTATIIPPITTAVATPAVDDLPFGFVANVDITGAVHENNQEIIEEPEITQKPWHNRFNKPRSYSLKPQFKSPTIKMSARGMKQLIYIAVIIIALVLLGGGTLAWAYWNLPKATVIVYVKPDNLEKQIVVTAAEKTTQVANNSVPAQKFTVELKETRESATTGKRQTGQVAKGEVTMTNKTGSPKIFSAGTELRVGDKKFTLTESVTVASSSAQSTADGETKTYGKSNVKVNATDIGPEGNIEKDTSLAVSGFTKDDYEGKATETFGGGSKKDIKVISAIDRTNLSRNLKSDMQLKVPTLVREKATGDDILLTNAWQITSTTEKFSKSVNDEADVISVDVTMKIDGYTYKKGDVEKLLENVATASIPEGYELKDNTRDTRTDLVSLSKEGVLTFNAVSRVSIIPTIDSASIGKQILGKQEDAARKTILDNNKIFDVSFEYSVRMPGPFITLPHKQENITVTRGVR